MLAAILLPWKLVMVMTTQNIPWGTPSVLTTLPEKQLVVALGILAAFAFTVYAACEILIGWVCKSGSAYILSKNHKTGLFNGHDEQATLLYRRFLRAVAGSFTILAITALLFYLYPYMAFSLLSYLAIGLLLIKLNSLRPFVSFLTPEIKSTIWWGGWFFLCCYLVGF